MNNDESEQTKIDKTFHVFHHDNLGLEQKGLCELLDVKLSYQLKTKCRQQDHRYLSFIQ